MTEQAETRITDEGLQCYRSECIRYRSANGCSTTYPLLLGELGEYRLSTETELPN
jgi:hypothetical protein